MNMPALRHQSLRVKTMKSNLKTWIAIAAVALPLAGLPQCAWPESRVVVAEIPGATHPGYLGVGVQDVTDDRVAELKLKDTHGVEVIALDHDGPAAKVGIREHDVIVQMNGQEVASADQLRRMMRETPAGRKATFVLSRDGQPVSIEVVLGDRAASEHAALSDLPQLNLQLENIANGMPNMAAFDLGDFPMDFAAAYSARTGAQVESLGPQLARYFGARDGVGILVKEVRPDSAAAKAGLKAGDVIVRAAGQPVSGRVEWERLLRDNGGSSLSVEILRDKHSQKLTVAVAKRQQGSVSPEQMQGLQEQLKSLQASLGPVQEEAMRESMAQAQREITAHRGDVDKAMAEVKKQIDSPEFKRQMADASAEAARAAAEFQNSAEWKQQVQQAQAEAQKAADEWSKDRPRMEQQMRDMQEQLKKAGEEMREQTTPMD
jgi:serine protease Do